MAANVSLMGEKAPGSGGRGGETRSIPGHGRTCQARRITFIEALGQEGK